MLAFMQEEEEIYYPALAALEDFADEIEDNVADHEMVKDNLAEMSGLEPTSDEFQNLLTETKAAIEMHGLGRPSPANRFPDECGFLFTGTAKQCKIPFNLVHRSPTGASESHRSFPGETNEVDHPDNRHLHCADDRLQPERSA